MTMPDLSQMTDDQLVDRFAEIGVAQEVALDGQGRKKYNRLYGQMDDVDNELRRRGLSSRLKLTTLFSHASLQVRVRAAARTMGIAPQEARAVLQTVADSKWPTQGLDAGMLLSGLDNGTWKPD
jgi:hypothetical protein